MTIGFTGTQKGMTVQQLEKLRIILSPVNMIAVVHHGDCIGADKQFHELCTGLEIPVVIHPPINESKRAFCKEYNTKILEPKDYLERNHDIVDDCQILIATPKERYEVLRSGTWATIRYARKKNKQIIIIYPNGEMKK